MTASIDRAARVLVAYYSVGLARVTQLIGIAQERVPLDVRGEVLAGEDSRAQWRAP